MISPQDDPNSRGRIWLHTKAAAEHIGSTFKTLERWRTDGVGPPYAKAGRRVVYRLDLLDEWLGSRIVTSSAEARRTGLIRPARP